MKSNCLCKLFLILFLFGVPQIGYAGILKYDLNIIEYGENILYGTIFIDENITQVWEQDLDGSMKVADEILSIYEWGIHYDGNYYEGYGQLTTGGYEWGDDHIWLYNNDDDLVFNISHDCTGLAGSIGQETIAWSSYAAWFTVYDLGNGDFAELHYGQPNEDISITMSLQERYEDYPVPVPEPNTIILMSMSILILAISRNVKIFNNFFRRLL